MIVVRVELWSFGEVRELMRMHITNDSTVSDSPRGNYFVEVFRKGSLTDVIRTGTVKDYPRRDYPVGRLLTRALLACFPEERRARAKIHRPHR